MFFYDIEKTDAISMVAVINDIILRLGLDGGKLIGQCYDGCSTMIGKEEEFQLKLKTAISPLLYPRIATYIPTK